MSELDTSIAVVFEAFGEPFDLGMIVSLEHSHGGWTARIGPITATKDTPTAAIRLAKRRFGVWVNAEEETLATLIRPVDEEAYQLLIGSGSE